jgi:type VI secretion system Hcp family effector
MKLTTISNEEDEMNRTNRDLIAEVRFAVFAGVLMFVCATGAYAQGGAKKNADTGNIKVVITGIPGDNADGSIEAFAIDQQIGLRQLADSQASRPAFAVTITKGIDSASPRLALFLATGGHLSRVIITWTKIDPATQLVSSYTVSLSDVLINSIRQRPANAKDPESKDLAEYEEVGFSFGRIEWEYRSPNGAQTRGGFDIRKDTTF